MFGVWSFIELVQGFLCFCRDRSVVPRISTRAAKQTIYSLTISKHLTLKTVFLSNLTQNFKLEFTNSNRRNRFSDIPRRPASSARKNPEKLLLSLGNVTTNFEYKVKRRLQFNSKTKSKVSKNIDFLGQYTFPVRIFLSKNLQVAGGER